MKTSFDIVLISNADTPSFLHATLMHEFKDSAIHEVHDQAALTSFIALGKTDIVVCDWNVRWCAPQDVCSSLSRSAATADTLVVGVVSSHSQLEQALKSHCHHVVDTGDSELSEHVFKQNVLLLKKICVTRAENRILLSEVRTKKDSERQFVAALGKTVQVRFPDVADFTPFALSAVEWIVDQFRHEEDAELEKADIIYAAQLAWLGKMHLPDTEKNTRVTLEGAPVNSFTAFVPLQADALLEGVDALAGARTILKNVYENYDGTGFPDRKQHWQIPLGSRVLRALCDLEETARVDHCSFLEALEHIKKFNRRVYDHRVVALLEEYLVNVSKRSNDHSDTRAIPLHDLHEGMTLASDIVTNSGLKLMNAGTVLHENLIRRIQSHNAMDPILGNVYIHR